MKQYFGLIEILQVANDYVPGFNNKESEKTILLEHIRFVHYPDCQQLILWLPDYYAKYHDATIRNTENDIFVFDYKVADIISGSIQILIDTLFIYPGIFELKIRKKDGIVHTVLFKKYPEGEIPELTKTPITEVVNPDSEPIVYRDGFGNILPNEDLLLRDNAIQKTIQKITRHVDYINQGREGEAIYKEGDKSIKFLMEPGAYDCIFYLNIPSTEDWEKTTHFPLSERDDIISFVANETQRDQASSCYFIISEREISYHKK